MLWSEVFFSLNPERIFFYNLFIYGYTGSSWLHVLSLIAANRGYSLRYMGFSLWWLLSLQSRCSRVHGLPELWLTVLITPRHMGASWTRDWTYVPALVGRFLTTRPPGKSEHFIFVLLQVELECLVGHIWASFISWILRASPCLAQNKIQEQKSIKILNRPSLVLKKSVGNMTSTRWALSCLFRRSFQWSLIGLNNRWISVCNPLCHFLQELLFSI